VPQRATVLRKDSRPISRASLFNRRASVVLWNRGHFRLFGRGSGCRTWPAVGFQTQRALAARLWSAALQVCADPERVASGRTLCTGTAAVPLHPAGEANRVRSPYHGNCSRERPDEPGRQNDQRLPNVRITAEWDLGFRKQQVLGSSPSVGSSSPLGFGGLRDSERVVTPQRFPIRLRRRSQLVLLLESTDGSGGNLPLPAGVPLLRLLARRKCRPC
jgi:hypothetical protein